MVDELLQGLARRDRRSLARLLSLAAAGEHQDAIESGLASLPRHPARVIAFTGSAGVGKSTLVGKMIEQARAEGKTVAVLACDPQSPLTGGALLGDRFRMGLQGDDGVFIRSLAAPGGSEAIAPHLPIMIRLLRVFGFDLVFLETVGAGQTDTAVSRLADLVVLLSQPESGDDLQWEKAGVLEVADVIVVHKADLPGTERTLGQLKSVLELSPAREIKVLAVSSQRGQGLEDLYGALWKEVPDRAGRAGSGLPSLVREEFEERLRRLERLEAFERLEREWNLGRLSETQARRTSWRLLGSMESHGADDPPRHS